MELESSFLYVKEYLGEYLVLLKLFNWFLKTTVRVLLPCFRFRANQHFVHFQPYFEPYQGFRAASYPVGGVTRPDRLPRVIHPFKIDMGNNENTFFTPP